MQMNEVPSGAIPGKKPGTFIAYSLMADRLVEYDLETRKSIRLLPKALKKKGA